MNKERKMDDEGQTMKRGRNEQLGFEICGKLCVQDKNFEILVPKRFPNRVVHTLSTSRCRCVQRSFTKLQRYPCRVSATFSREGQTQEDNKQKDLYSILGVDPTASSEDIRKAFFELSKRAHPDIRGFDGKQEQDTPTFHSLKDAYDILKEPKLRKIYDSLGLEGVHVIRNKQTISSSQDEGTEKATGLEDSGLADYLAAEIATSTPLLEECSAHSVGENTNALPRNVEEAVANILYHENSGYRYFALWWISKNRVMEAEEALVQVLKTSREQTALGGYPLKRRAAVALGNIASIKAIIPLSDTLSQTSDKFLRYRCAEALATIARIRGSQHFSSCVIQVLVNILNKGLESFQQENMISREDSNMQLFELEHLSAQVRKKLENIFEKRKQNERRQKRMTHTPNLGVGPEYLEYPLEWCLKALGFLHRTEYMSLVNSYTEHPIPLVKYAAYKALYQWTGQVSYIQPLLNALSFGEEHHYTQRVLIRDLGEVGYLPAAKEIAACPMVENSFKLFALRKLSSYANYDLSQPHMIQLLDQLDELL